MGSKTLASHSLYGFQGVACKKRYPGRILVEGPLGRVEASSVILHPRGCMGARHTHLDFTLPRDPCGLTEYLSKGGARANAWRSGGCLEVDLTLVLGVECRLSICPPPVWGSRVYLMLSRSGSLYLTVQG